MVLKFEIQRLHVKTSNSSSLKSVFEKLSFNDRLMWQESQTGEINLHFQIPPGYICTVPGCFEKRRQRQQKKVFSMSLQQNSQKLTEIHGC